MVSLQLTTEGSKKFAEATEANLGKQIAIVYDGETISAPTVQSVISDGKAQITGMSSIEDARELASTIRIGSLSLELEEMRSNVVGAQLGQEAIKTSLTAAAIGMVIVMVFMIVVYLLPGVVAALSLLIYTGLMLVMLNAFDLTLTLPGIAGIVLSIGMAVDANVIIYARIREEIAIGKSVRNAIKSGFQKALSAILDGNITTLIAAAVLGLLGERKRQRIRNDAGTRYRSVHVHGTRDLAAADQCDVFGRASESKTLRPAERAQGHQLCGKEKSVFAISIVLVLLAPIGMGIFSAKDSKALNYSLEFIGGTSTTVTFNEEYTLNELEENIRPVIEEVTGTATFSSSRW